MKTPHWFALILVLLLGLMFLLEYHLPKKFVWNPTFSHHDHQPFGCAVFDDVLSASCPAGYSLSNKTFFQLAEDSTDTSRPALLVIAQRIDLGEIDRNALLKLLTAGRRVMLVSSSFNPGLSNALHFDHSYGWFQLRAIKKYAASLQPRDSLSWVASSVAPVAADTFVCYPHLCNVYFLPRDSSFVPLVTMRIDSVQMQNDSLPSCFPAVAMRRQVGQGELILVSTPLLFTNYGMLDGRNADYLFRLLSQLGTVPIVRIEAYGIGSQRQESPLQYILSQTALRWALYFTMGVILVFMFCNARRRQRAIPVLCSPENKTLEFVELIGTLYYQQHQSLDLVRKQFVYFAETLRRTIQMDVEDATDDVLLARRIASKTGIDEAEIIGLLRKLRPLVSTEGEQRPQETVNGRQATPLTEQEMKQYIDQMNHISRCSQ